MKKRRKKYVKKRTTFRALLIRALAVVLALTAAFAVGFQAWLKNNIDDQCWEWAKERRNVFQRLIQDCKYELAEDGPERRMQIVRSQLALHNEYFEVIMPDGEDSRQAICPTVFPDCRCCAVLADEKGNIAATDRALLWAILSFQDDDPNIHDPAHTVSNLKRLYLCDPEQLKLPEVEQFFQQCAELSVPTEDSVNYVYVEFTSLYVNRAEHSFIPHEGKLIVNSWDRSKALYDDYYDTHDCEVTEYPVELNVDLPGYELMELHAPVTNVWYETDEESGEVTLGERERYLSEVAYPYAQGGLVNYFGAPKAELEEFKRIQSFSEDLFGRTWSYHRLENGSAVYSINSSVELDGKTYTLHLRFMLNYKNEIVLRFYFKYLALFAAALTLLALLWCLWKNQKNKLCYAMEDYQRALTDNLAHDVKTPLMAISGYTENVLKGRLTEAERAEYLNAILDNVSYTDSLVSRTLQLNHMGEAKQGKPERIALEKLAAELLQKYEPLLGEKQITHRIEGSATVEADPAAMETILENLISNAVKYTPERGEVRVAVEKKVLRVTNSVAQKLEVKKLKEPFVRGDAARSNVKGNGLGLALAEQAAKLNGFKLNLSCTDKTFTAELKM